jgi:hypothetical protein
MKDLHSQMEINASEQRVWRLLTDSPPYPQWNPFIRRVSGEARIGERLQVRFEPPGSLAITLRSEVLDSDPNHQLRWLGHLFVPGLFDGEHCFDLQPLRENRVRFVQREALRGLLVPLFARSLDNTLRGFKVMNHALKERAEAVPEGG